jgi:hypothetical protein
MTSTNEIRWRPDIFDGIASHRDLDNALHELSDAVCPQLYISILEHFFGHDLVVEVILSGLFQRQPG